VSEFDRQIDTLIEHGIHTLTGVRAESFRELVEPLRASAELLEQANPELFGIPESGDLMSWPFVVVPPPRSLNPEQLVPLMTLAGATRTGILDRNHGAEGLAPYRSLPELQVADGEPYLLVDIDRGEEFCGVRPVDAVKTITGRSRSPLTILEGIVLQLVRPELLQPNRCFMLAGSRRGDKRVPALWISAKAPKLGWCWEGNPHSWLGTASARERVLATVNA
jgi:hypothetical protein